MSASNTPVIPNDSSLIKGKHFVGIGSYKPNMREFPDALFQELDQCFIDVSHTSTESGDLIYPLKHKLINQNQIFTLGKLISKEVKLSDNSTSLFKSVGMALFDLFVAKLIYAKALEKGIGRELQR